MKAIANLKKDENVERISNSSGSRKSHPTYTPAFKLKAVNFAKQTSNSLAAKRFKVDIKSVRNWHKSEDKLKMR
jgi:transposase-like protein